MTNRASGKPITGWGICQRYTIKKKTGHALVSPVKAFWGWPLRERTTLAVENWRELGGQQRPPQRGVLEWEFPWGQGRAEQSLCGWQRMGNSFRKFEDFIYRGTPGYSPAKRLQWKLNITFRIKFCTSNLSSVYQMKIQYPWLCLQSHWRQRATDNQVSVSWAEFH